MHGLPSSIFLDRDTRFLRSLVGDNLKSWDTKLCVAEFAHNHAINRSSGFCPFNVVYGLVPRCPLDLAPLPDRSRIHGKAVDFIDNVIYHGFYHF